MASATPPAPFARRITFRMQSQDVRKWMVNDAERRARSAAVRAGGVFVRRVTPPKRIDRWCVNRSPHVNKTSREHFWMITHTRIIEWDAGRDVDIDAPTVIASSMPATVATRVEDNMPGLMALPVVWDLLRPSKDDPAAAAVAEASKGATVADVAKAAGIDAAEAATAADPAEVAARGDNDPTDGAATVAELSEIAEKGT